MKDKKNIKSFSKATENLNISDVSDSLIMIQDYPIIFYNT